MDEFTFQEIVSPMRLSLMNISFDDNVGKEEEGGGPQVSSSENSKGATDQMKILAHFLNQQLSVVWYPHFYSPKLREGTNKLSTT